MTNNDLLIEGDRIDDLLFQNLHIIQNKNLYSFSSDSVLLANFVKAKSNDTIVDLCSGSGIVGILSQAKTKAKNLILVEKQWTLADMCKRTLKLNNLTDKAIVCNEDINDFVISQNGKEFSVVCSNPPYYLPKGKKMSGNYQIDMAKFEIELTLDGLIKCASKLLKYGGKFFLINDSTRIAEIIVTLKKYNLEAKVLQFVFPKEENCSNVVLIEATKYGKGGTRVYIKKN